MQMQLPTHWEFRFRFPSNFEFFLHVPLWILYFASINVEWTGPWVKQDFLPQSVPPHIGVLFPIAFLANAFWLVPKYLNKKHWWRYGLILVGGILTFEAVRASIFVAVLKNGDSFSASFQEEILGVNSIIFGKLNFMLLNALFWSFVYRLTWNWFIYGKNPQTNTLNDNQNATAEPGAILPKAFFETKKGKGTLRLAVEDVVCFQAQGDFVLAIDHAHRKHIINTSLKKVFAALGKNQFFQLNRSEIVHKKYIMGYQKHIKNRLVIQTVLKDFPLYTSNSRTPAFRRWIKDCQ